MLNESDKDFVTNISLFQNLSNIQFEKLFSFLTTISHSSGATLFKQGDDADCLYIVRDGLVELYYTNTMVENGDQLLCTKESNNFFGEFSLLHAGKRLTTAVVADNSFLIILYRKDFEKLADEDPQIGYYIIKEISKRFFKPFTDNTDFFFKALL